jgi:TPR repeat protein
MAHESTESVQTDSKNYSEMSESDLLLLANDVASLTPNAREALQAEMEHRSLPIGDTQPAEEIQQPRGYRWGLFQARVMFCGGIVGVIISLITGYLPGVIDSCLGLITGWGLLKKYRYGVILFSVSAVISGLMAILSLVWMLFHIGISIATSEGSDQVSHYLLWAYVMSVWLCWFVLPARFYYPKRWNEFSKWSPRFSKAKLRDSEQNTTSDKPKKQSPPSVSQPIPDVNNHESQIESYTTIKERPWFQTVAGSISSRRMRVALSCVPHVLSNLLGGSANKRRLQYAGLTVALAVALDITALLVIPHLLYRSSIYGDPKSGWVAGRFYSAASLPPHTLFGAVSALTVGRYSPLHSIDDSIAYRDFYFSGAYRVGDAAARCASGQPEGCDEFARGFLYGTGLSKSRSRALVLVGKATILYEQACAAGNPSGCNNLGHHYADGIGVGQDEDKAAALYELACGGGDSDGCNSLANVYRDSAFTFQAGQPFTIDHPAESQPYKATLQNGTQANPAVDCDALAKKYGGVEVQGARSTLGGRPGFTAEKDSIAPRAVQTSTDEHDLARRDVYSSARDEGQPKERALLRVHEFNYVSRQGLSPQKAAEFAASLQLTKRLRDYPKAAALYEMACNGGSKEVLASLYDGGGGVRVDRVKAADLYRDACGLGSPDACDQLGNNYYNGTGVEKDDSRAKTLYAKATSLYRGACDIGQAASCSLLGYRYYTGVGAGQDYSRAFIFLTKGCYGGSGWGCYALGYLHQYAEGVPKDDDRSRRFYEVGCSEGYQEACDRIKEM